MCIYIQFSDEFWYIYKYLSQKFTKHLYSYTHVYIYIYIYTYKHFVYISKEMRSVILLPIMGEKLLLTIPEKYIIYLVAVRFDCTRQSSSAAISKEQKTQNYTESDSEPKFKFSAVLSFYES